MAKRNYSDKLRIQLSSSDLTSVWKGPTTSHHPPASPHMLQTLHHHPIPNKSKITGLNDYGSVALTSVVMKSFKKTGAGPPEGHHWTLAGSSTVCLQSKQVCGRCSQCGTTLCSATSRQTRDLCEDPVCGHQLGL